jgi:hypothetical protein
MTWWPYRVHGCGSCREFWERWNLIPVGVLDRENCSKTRVKLLSTANEIGCHNHFRQWMSVALRIYSTKKAIREKKRKGRYAE